MDSHEFCSKINDAMKRLNIDFSAISWRRFNLWGSKDSVQEIQRLQFQKSRAIALECRLIEARAELAAARDAALESRDALEDARDLLLMMDYKGDRANQITAPEDRAVRSLCETHGYGAVMDSAARQWFHIDCKGAFVVGPCAAIARMVHVRIAKALETQTGNAP